MPVLRINDSQHTLGPGKTRLGGGADVDIRVSDDERIGTQAVIDLAEGQSVIQRSGDAAVKVNGVPLGAEPTPLMHGDKIEVAGRELFYAEDTKGGTTRHVMQSEVRSILEKRPGAPRATIGSGGRLVSLVDGKEYLVPERGITIGRDASSDVVVAQNEVSRRHAEIVPSERGYLLHDHSTNGVHVNGVRVLQSQVLNRSDVVRVGGEEFRFYADVIISGTMPAATMPAGATPLTSQAPASPAPVATSARAERPKQPSSTSDDTAGPMPSVAPAAPADTTLRVSAVPDAPAPEPAPAAAAAQPSPAGLAAPAAADSRPVLAILEVINEGVSRGKRFEVRVPLAHVGRGTHNDVVIDDDSVSDIHAKLQRREDGWYLIDLSSTNGTYVGGSRLTHERRLDGAPDVRFGGVKLTFRAADVPVPAAKSTRAIASTPIDRSKIPPRQPRATAPAKPAPVAAPERATGGGFAWKWVIIVIAAVAVAFYLLKS
ncbi:MAG TPA: FHA domain-containing protein [Gemmatimonadaceae bacterium]|jgi:pSer/pThr/pTyr-binding forkhead associated (FHA) protein